MEPFSTMTTAGGRELSPSMEYGGGGIDENLRKMGITSPPEEEKPHIINSNGSEKILEYGGPNNRYGKLNVILGKGAYKVVWKAIDLEEGIEVAWNSCQTTKNEYAELSQEIEILKRVRHPNIITFLDSWYTNGELIFITEMMTSGTLREYVTKLKKPSIKIIRRWGKQLLRGLFYLHSQSPPIIHRDIKCDNIFINGSHGELKIGDMGTAKMRFGKKYTVIGTPEFMAPEMYEEKGYSEKVDIYAFGMCLLEMATGQYPYSECKNAAQIYKKVSQGLRPDCLAEVEDKDILTIVNGCIANEDERWTAKKLLEHPFFADDPEVVLLSADDKRTRLVLQVMFKGHDKPTIKFDFNTEADTAEEVVREMIQEQILASRYQVLVSNEIHRILKDINRLAMELPKAEYRPVSPQLPQDDGKGDLMTSSPTGSDRRTTMDSARSSDGPNALDFDFPFREYPSDFAIDDFIVDIASITKRPLEKAHEWLLKLKAQDIMTVGDLRHLHEEDWSQLNLTVFACRAIRNALSVKPRNLSTVIPQSTIRNSSIKPQSLLEDSVENLTSTSPINSSAASNQADLHTAPLIS